MWRNVSQTQRHVPPICEKLLYTRISIAENSPEWRTYVPLLASGVPRRSPIKEHTKDLDIPPLATSDILESLPDKTVGLGGYKFHRSRRWNNRRHTYGGENNGVTEPIVKSRRRWNASGRADPSEITRPTPWRRYDVGSMTVINEPSVTILRGGERGRGVGEERGEGTEYRVHVWQPFIHRGHSLKSRIGLVVRTVSASRYLAYQTEHIWPRNT